jgi:hypothetical protein
MTSTDRSSNHPATEATPNAAEQQERTLRAMAFGLLGWLFVLAWTPLSGPSAIVVGLLLVLGAGAWTRRHDAAQGPR